MTEMSLKRSERNSIIEDFRSGVLHPEYEVTVTKTPGKFMVRKRKIPLTDEQLDDLYEAQAYKNYPTWFASKAPANRSEPFGSSSQRPTGEQRYSEADDDTSSPSPSTFANIKPKRSKKENALFDLQNQLNTQMLHRINELTNKVVKLKAWKKKVKQELYEDAPEEPDQMSEQPEPQGQDMEMNTSLAEGVSEPTTQSPNIQAQEQPSPDITYDYMNQIPEEVYNASSEVKSVETSYTEPTYNFSRTRNSIDYSKFGF